MENGRAPEEISKQKREGYCARDLAQSWVKFLIQGGSDQDEANVVDFRGYLFNGMIAPRVGYSATLLSAFWVSSRGWKRVCPLPSLCSVLLVLVSAFSVP